MTKVDAQRILLRAFVSTGELPPEIEKVLQQLLALTERQGKASSEHERSGEIHLFTALSVTPPWGSD